MNLCLDVFQDHQCAFDLVLIKEKWLESETEGELPADTGTGAKGFLLNWISTLFINSQL